MTAQTQHNPPPITPILQAVMVCLCFVALHATADTTASVYGVFCGAKNELKGLRLLPIQQMDDEQLYSSAIYLQDHIVSAHQRALNYYWLQQSRENTATGGKALAKLLRFGFLSYRKNTENPWDEQDNRTSILNNIAFVTHWRNYKLRASNRRIALKYTKEF